MRKIKMQQWHYTCLVVFLAGILSLLLGFLVGSHAVSQEWLRPYGDLVQPAFFVISALAWAFVGTTLVRHYRRQKLYEATLEEFDICPKTPNECEAVQSHFNFHLAMRAKDFHLATEKRNEFLRSITVVQVIADLSVVKARLATLAQLEEDVKDAEYAFRHPYKLAKKVGVQVQQSHRGYLPLAITASS